LVLQLLEMGFNLNGCRKAVYHTPGQGIEAAMNWILEHMSDANFESPLELPSSKTRKPSAAAPVAHDPSKIEMLKVMGFTEAQAIKGLDATKGDLEAAADYLFTNPGQADDAMDAVVAAPSASSAPDEVLDDGPGRYRLRAFITHMGTSTSSGHYVCHILKDGKWIMYNDSKVAISEAPPREYAYLYLFERI